MNLLNPKVTEVGRNMIAAAVDGDEIAFTRIVLGDGFFEGDDAAGATDVVHVVEEIPISRHSVSNNVATLVAIYTNENETTGFQLREIGVYAENSTNEESLFAYGFATSDSEADYIPPTGGPVVIEKQVELHIPIGNAQNVSAFLDPGASATLTDYEELRRICRQAVSTANDALTLAGEAWGYADRNHDLILKVNQQVIKNKTRISIIWDALFNDIAANRNTVDFDTVHDAANADATDANIISGTWNADLQRVEI